MPGSDPQQRQRRPLWYTPPLLPVAERVNTDPESTGEHLLGQPGEAPQQYHVPTLKLPSHEALTDPSREGAREVSGRQFPNLVLHRLRPPLYS